MGGAQVHVLISSGSDTEPTEGNIDSDSEYDLESLMDTDEGSDNESVNWENYEQELRSQLLPSRSASPISLSIVHVPDDYRPATPIYSPTPLTIHLA